MKRRVPQAAVKKRQATPEDVEIGHRVRAKRLDKGLSQTTLAERIGVTFQQVQKYEKGTNRIGAGRLKRIAAALTVPVVFFFAEPETKGAPEEESTFGWLQNAKAVRLIKAFHRVKSPKQRDAIVAFVEDAAQSS